MRIKLALRTMFRVLRDASCAQRIQDCLEAPPTPLPAPRETTTRSEALTMLACLQREGRLVDFLMESIDAYSDAQIGAAVRDVHRDCHATLQRIFALEPLETRAEGSNIDIPANYDPAACHLTGNLTGQPPYQGTIRHHGWKAAHCKLPEWNGREESLLVLAPVEVEIA